MFQNRPDIDGMMGALEAGSLEGVAKRLYNVFEEVLPEEMRQEVQGIKTVMLRCGAMGAAMSGSGPAVFGIFRTGRRPPRPWSRCGSGMSGVSRPSR